MGAIPGYDVIVTRNGSGVRAKSGRVRKTTGNVGLDWDLAFHEPMNISLGTSVLGDDSSGADLWTIQRRVGGYPQTWVNEAPARSRSGETGLTSTRNVSGNSASVAANDILEYGVPKTIVFFNPAWLAEKDPTAAVKDGIIKVKGLGGAWTRLYNDRLPGKEFTDDTFICYPGSTHHDIGKQLARMVGYTLIVNTPDVSLVDTFTINAGTKWMDAIKTNFMIWDPYIEPPDDGQTIYILDKLTDEATVKAFQIVSIDNPAIVSVSDSVSKDMTPEVDHLIIIGRKTKDSVGIPSEPPDYTPITIPEGPPLTIDEEIPANVDCTNMLEQLQLPNQTCNFGDPDNPVVPKAGKRQVHIMRNHIIRNPVRGDQRVPVQEETQIYDSDDTMVSKTVVEYKHSAALKPIKTTESHYIYDHDPGSSSYELKLRQVKTTWQDQWIRPLNLTLTRELYEDTILYENATKAGVSYKDDPQILMDVLRQDNLRDTVDKETSTQQAVLTMPTRFRMTYISRVSDDLLIKRDIDYNVLSANVKFQSQVLQNPVPMISIQSKDAIFRREYYREGAGKLINGVCSYRNVKTINHQDICTDAIAEEIRDRYFEQLGTLEDNTEYVINCPVPIPWEGLNYIIRLPNFTQLVNGVPVTVDGGDYVLHSWEESFSFDGDGNVIEAKPQQKITVRKRP